MNLAKSACQQNEPLAPLWYTKICRVQYVPIDFVTGPPQRIKQLNESRIRSESRHIFEHHRLGLRRLNESKELKNQIVAVIVDLSSAVQGSQRRETLARWATSKKV